MLAELLSRYKSGSSLAITILFCLSCLIWKSNILSRTASQAVRVLDFFSSTFFDFGKGVSQFVDSYGSYEAMRLDRDKYCEEIKTYHNLEVELKRLNEENVKLRNFLRLPPLTSYPVIQAEVISQDPDNWFRTIIINKGSAEGIAPYMPVVGMQINVVPSADGKSSESKLLVGVVGKVIQVNQHSARILPLTDQFSRIGVTLKKTGHWALLLGQSPQSDAPLMDFLSLGVFLNSDDEVVTSGGDGIFPRDLPIGRIGKRIERLGSFQKAEVIPVIDFKRLDFVIVIQKKIDTAELDFLPLKAENVPEPKVIAAPKTKTVKAIDEDDEVEAPKSSPKNHKSPEIISKPTPSSAIEGEPTLPPAVTPSPADVQLPPQPTPPTEGAPP